MDKVSKKTPMERRGVEVEKIEKIIGSKGLSVSITGGGRLMTKKSLLFFLGDSYSYVLVGEERECQVIRIDSGDFKQFKILMIPC